MIPKGTVFEYADLMWRIGRNLSIFRRNLETPIGPAAGPNSRRPRTLRQPIMRAADSLGTEDGADHGRARNWRHA